MLSIGRLSIVSLCVVISACSVINTLHDENEVFINVRNSEIDKKLSVVLKSTRYYNYWEGNKHNSEYKKPTIVPVANGYSEYHFENGICKWSLKVKSSTQQITGWRYLSNEKVCKYKHFYEGPF